METFAPFPAYKALHLTAEKADLAYPLVQAFVPALPLAGWRAFVSAHLAIARHGLLTATDPGGVICGLAIYRIEPHLRHGQVLVVDEVMALGLLIRRIAADVLLDALEAIARQQGCQGMHTALVEEEAPEYRHWIQAMVQARGPCLLHASLCRQLANGAPLG